MADTNIFLAVVLEEPEKREIVRITSSAELFAPEILPYEIGNALSAMVKRGRLDAAQAMAALDVVSRIPVRLSAVDIESALEIALNQNLYAYDAYFLENARRLDLPLLTLDRKMAEVAQILGLDIIMIGNVQ
jgi:predicted nucleic acid-binding protein